MLVIRLVTVLSQSFCIMSIACEEETQSKASTMSPSRFHWWLCGKNSPECNEVQPQGFFFLLHFFPEDNVFFTNNLAAIRSSSSSSECLTRALGVSSEGSLESNEVRLYTFLCLPLAWPVLSPFHSLRPPQEAVVPG